MILQPCDWYEHDLYDRETNTQQYVVDAFGRTEKNKVACIRITGFKPFFYVKSEKKPEGGIQEEKYDVFAGFNELKTTKVWKIECGSKKEFTEKTKTVKGKQYESNIPPFLRLFHARHLGPASPFKCKEVRDQKPKNYEVEEFYTCDYNSLEPVDANIPLKVVSYDLEMYSESGLFPQAKKGDPIVQIGVSYRWSNDLLKPISRKVFVVGSVSPSDDKTVKFLSCKDEEQLLRQFALDIQTENPDVMCGYNIFGFDDAYIEDRCYELDLLGDDGINLARYPSKIKSGEAWVTKFTETKRFELASGKYDLRFLCVKGRMCLDLLLNMRREHSLDSFKLDNVASVFLKDKVIEYNDGRVQTKSTRGLRVGNYVCFNVVGNTSDPYRDGEKYVVTSVDAKGFEIHAPGTLFTDLDDKQRKNLEWTFAKDDVDHHELFDLHANGGPNGRGRIAKYCIQDCDLVLTLMAKLDTLVNARGMADVCKVPMEYVLRRGQGIKIFSAILYYASQRNQIIQVQPANDDDYGYEGAIVISPKIGMYLDQPISVLDFNSLYPSNMIAYNLSPDTLVAVRVFNKDGELLKNQCEGLSKEQMDVLSETYTIDCVEYDDKESGDIHKCYYVQPTTDPMTVGVIPKTLDILLKKRKEFKEKMEDKQYDEAQRSVYNGLQLAYKVVANSVYGQCGSRTSPIRKLCVAACTTAAGRKALYTAKSIVETEFGAEVVYGDTDSIFIKFPTKSLAESIEFGLKSGERITSSINRRPYKIAYEKTFYPFILFCRKRYVGMMYEEDPSAKPKRKSMGIVLKRRDNAPIVKDVFGGALDILMQEQNVKKAQAFTMEMLKNVLENKVPLEKFIVTKSLRDDYKNPEQIAHRVLANRMEARDAGTAPKVGDRIAFVYVAENKNARKQGDRIEEIGYVREKKLTPDAEFYITNQIQNPVAQLFALCIEQLDGYVAPRRPTYESLYKDYREVMDEEDATLKVIDRKEKQLDSLMFLGSPVLSKIVKKKVRGPMDAFTISSSSS